MLYSQVSAQQTPIPCTFYTSYFNITGPEQPCGYDDSYYDVMDYRGSSQQGLWEDVFCLLNAGTGYSQTGVTTYGGAYPFTSVYGSTCSLTVNYEYACQYSDPTIYGPDALDYYIVREYGGAMCTFTGAGAKCRMKKSQDVGDPCVVQSECASNSCINGVCQPRQLYTDCDNFNDECGTAKAWCSYSAGGLCVPITPLGSPCSYGGECGRGAYCNFELPNPICQQAFSVTSGQSSSTFDLCSSGLMSYNDYTCISARDNQYLGKACNNSQGYYGPPGYDCECSKLPNGDMYYAYAYTEDRTDDMAASYKAAYQCMMNAKAPDGTPCKILWDYEYRIQSMFGTCGWLQCHQEIQTYLYYFTELSNNDPYDRFYHYNKVMQNIEEAYGLAAYDGKLACGLPSEWASYGWTCSSLPPNPAARTSSSSLSTGQLVGYGFLIVIGVVVVGFVGWFYQTRGKIPNVAETVEVVKSLAEKVTGSGGKSYSSASSGFSSSSSGFTSSSSGFTSSATVSKFSSAATSSYSYQ
jgi:hypothetical protein